MQNPETPCANPETLLSDWLKKQKKFKLANQILAIAIATRLAENLRCCFASRWRVLVNKGLKVRNFCIYIINKKSHGILVHSWNKFALAGFQKAQIALALRARAILNFLKTCSCKFIPKCTRNHAISYTNQIPQTASPVAYDGLRHPDEGTKIFCQ